LREFSAREIGPHGEKWRLRHDRPIMAVTQADIDSLNQAIADGVRQVTIGGQTVTYNTTESLIKARNDMREELRRQNADGAPRRSRRIQMYHGGRGFE
jgi:hypothetical protein